MHSQTLHVYFRLPLRRRPFSRALKEIVFPSTGRATLAAQYYAWSRSASQERGRHILLLIQPLCIYQLRKHPLGGCLVARRVHILARRCELICKSRVGSGITSKHCSLFVPQSCHAQLQSIVIERSPFWQPTRANIGGQRSIAITQR